MHGASREERERDWTHVWVRYEFFNVAERTMTGNIMTVWLGLRSWLDMQRTHQLLQEQPAGARRGPFTRGACLVLSPWFSSKWMEEEALLLGVTLRTRQTRGSREGVGKGGRRKKKRRGTML